MRNGGLDVANTLIANLIDVQNGSFEYTRMGATLAAMSPSSDAIRKSVTPVMENGDVSRDTVTQKPKVKVQNLLPVDMTVSDAISCAAGQIVNGVQTTELTLDKEKQIAFRFSRQQFQALQTESLANITRLRQSGQGNFSANLFNRTPLIDLFNTRIMQGVDSILKKIEEDAIDSMIANFGINAKYGVNTAQSVPFFDANLSQKPHFFYELGEWRILNKLQGTPIVVGGIDVFNLVQSQKIAGLAASGIDYNKFGNNVPFEFYYSDLAENLGTKQFAVIAPNSFIFLSHPRYAHINKLNGTDSFANNKYGTFNVQIGTEGKTKTLTFDLRVREVACDPAYNSEETVIIELSLSYDFWAKPANFVYPAGHALAGVNGLTRYQVA